MKTIVMIVAGLLLSANLAHAQPAGQPGQPPAFKIVSGVDKTKGLILIRETVTKTIPV